MDHKDDPTSMSAPDWLNYHRRKNGYTARPLRESADWLMNAERDSLFPTLDLIQKYGMLSDFDQDDLIIYTTIMQMGLTTKQMNTVGEVFLEFSQQTILEG